VTTVDLTFDQLAITEDIAVDSRAGMPEEGERFKLVMSE
jgi:hypothetical protein